jgi:hypothetical protein
MTVEIRSEVYSPETQSVIFVAKIDEVVYLCYVPIEDLAMKSGHKAVDEFARRLREIEDATEAAIAKHVGTERVVVRLAGELRKGVGG